MNEIKNVIKSLLACRTRVPLESYQKEVQGEPTNSGLVRVCGSSLETDRLAGFPGQMDEYYQEALTQAALAQGIDPNKFQILFWVCLTGGSVFQLGHWSEPGQSPNHSLNGGTGAKENGLPRIQDFEKADKTKNPCEGDLIGIFVALPNGIVNP